MTGQCFNDYTSTSELTLHEDFQIKASALRGDYKVLIEAVRNAAPSARIAVVGYPYVIGSDSSGVCVGFSREEVSWLRSSTDQVNELIRDIAASSSNVEFAALAPAYEGHGACTDDQFINDFDYSTFGCGACSTPDDLSALGVQIAGSFHPNRAGHNAATPEVLDALTRASGSKQGPGRIEGRLFLPDSTNQPEDLSASLTIYKAQDLSTRGDPVRNVSVATDGTFLAADLPAGCFIVALRAPAGHVFEYNREAQLDQYTCVTDNETREMLVPLYNAFHNRTFTGTITKDGRRTAGATVDLYRSDGTGARIEWGNTTITTGTPVGPNYLLNVPASEADCWVLTFTAPEGEVFPNGTRWKNVHHCIDFLNGLTNIPINVELASDAGGQTISGTVRQAGNTIRGVEVTRFTQNNDGSRGDWIDSTSTNADGAYSLDALPGCYTLTFVAPSGSTFVNGSQWYNRSVCLEQNESAEGIDAELSGGAQSGQTITGTVRQGNTTVPGVGVDRFTAAADGSRGAWIETTPTNHNGAFTFDASPGCYVLTFTAPNGSTFVNGSQWYNRSVCLEQNENAEGIDAELSGGAQSGQTITGTVRQGNTTVPGVGVDRFTAAADGSRGAWIETTPTNHNGAFTFDASPGCYVLTFTAPNGSTFVNGSQWYNRSVCLEQNENAEGIDAELQ